MAHRAESSTTLPRVSEKAPNDLHDWAEKGDLEHWRSVGDLAKDLAAGIFFWVNTTFT